jgi:hypothetical protein
LFRDGLSETGGRICAYLGKSLFGDNIGTYWRAQLEFNKQQELKGAKARGDTNEVARMYKRTIDCWEKVDASGAASGSELEDVWKQCFWTLYKKPLTSLLLKAKNGKL